MEDNKTLTLPLTGKSVVIKAYMSGFDDQEIQTILAAANKTTYETEVNPTGDNNVKINPGATKVIMAVDPTVKFRADQKTLELMVLSVDGVTTDVVNAVLALPKQDVDYIKEQIKGVENTSKVVANDPKVPTA